VQELQEALSGNSGGSVLTESSQLVDLAFSLLMLKVPSHWVDLVGSSAPPATWPLKDWVQDIVLRFVFLDRVLIGGLSKTPTYWLGGFFNPLAFLSVVKQVSPVSSSVAIDLGFIVDGAGCQNFPNTKSYDMHQSEMCSGCAIPVIFIIYVFEPCHKGLFLRAYHIFIYTFSLSIPPPPQEASLPLIIVCWYRMQ
jgi:hypothetical protein